MKKLVECVPNFSEGIQPKILEKILEKIRAVSEVHLLGYEMDPDHNRSVVTFVGTPEGVKEAAFQAIKKASEVIDLNKHKGEHPRMGATDVCPFIPVQNISMDECVEIAKDVAKRVGDELQIPIFCYEEAATRPERKNLAKVRKGQFEKLKDLIGQDPEREPDYGPNSIHPTAGATAIGARFFLIAYNVNLKSTDVKLAKKIGKSIREKNGGFPCVKAMGFSLEERSMVQVSMNLTDYRKTSMNTVFDEIEKQANEAGVEVCESEIVGLIPLDALESLATQSLKLTGFQRNQIIEQKIAESMQDPFYATSPFIEATASKSPTPGGGSVSALAGALAASLGEMVLALTVNKKKYEAVKEELFPFVSRIKVFRSELFSLVKEDSEAYSSFSKARKMKKDTEEEKKKRQEAMDSAMMKSILVPADTMKKTLELLSVFPILVEKGNPNAVSDVGVACHLAIAAIEGAILNVRINLGMLKDEKVKEEFLKQIEETKNKASQLQKNILSQVEAKLS